MFGDNYNSDNEETISIYSDDFLNGLIEGLILYNF